LSDDVNYLQVTISDATFGSDTEAIRFDVTALDPLTSNAGANFGIQTFGFNTTGVTGDVADAVLGLPDGWSTDTDRNISAFGSYDVQVSGTGGSRQDPTLTFYVSGISGDTIADYAALSSGNAGEGNMFFAAHVAGFTDQDPGEGEVTSAFFAGPGAVIPVPAAAWLLGSALALLGMVRVRQR
jgi:hypothetical protein